MFVLPAAQSGASKVPPETVKVVALFDPTAGRLMIADRPSAAIETIRVPVWRSPALSVISIPGCQPAVSALPEKVSMVVEVCVSPVTASSEYPVMSSQPKALGRLNPGCVKRT